MKPCLLTETGECPHAEKSAELAVKKVFAILGVDIDVPRDVEDFRKDLRFGQSMRRAADKSVMAVISLIAISCMAALWVGIVDNIRGR